MNAAELLRLRRENAQLTEAAEQLRRERDRALIAASLFVCEMDEQRVGPAAERRDEDRDA